MCAKYEVTRSLGIRRMMKGMTLWEFVFTIGQFTALLATVAAGVWVLRQFGVH